MIENPGLAAGHHPVADFSRASDTKHGGEQTIAADFYVVGDVTKIIGLGAGADFGRPVTSAIDAVAGADAHVVSDNDIAGLRDFIRLAFFILGKAETLRTDDT